MMLETIRNDPGDKNGDYTMQPSFLKIARVFFGIATSGGTLNYQKQAPTREQADKIVEARLAAPMPADANDFLWQWGSSADYDAAPGLEHIEATLLAINSADDERNPPETGLMVGALKRVKDGKTLPNSRKRTDQRTPHHRKRQVLLAADRRIAQDGAATGEVGPRTGSKKPSAGLGFLSMSAPGVIHIISMMRRQLPQLPS